MTLLQKDNKLQSPGVEKQGSNHLFPVFLKLEELHTVLIGAGNVGLEKLTAILNNSPDARVTVIALAVLPEVYALADAHNGLSIIQKAFNEAILDSADLVIAATNDGQLNNYIRLSAHERKLLINVADKPELCDFYLGSIVQKGNLKIGISTNGKSPTVAKRLKEVLNEGLPVELDTTLQQMSQLRDSLKGDFAYKVKTLNAVTSVLVEPKLKDKKDLTGLTWRQIALAIAAKIGFRQK